MKLHTPGKPDLDTTPKLEPVSLRELVDLIDLILRSDSRPDYHLDAAKSRLREIRKRL